MIPGLDPECTALVDAINRIPGLYTTSSCCGHGEHPVWIFFRVDSDLDFPILLYYTDRCHVGFNWDCIAYTDCGMQPVTYRLESEVMGDEAYKQADVIAAAINEYLDELEEEE